MKLQFVIPDWNEFASGGNEYNKNLIFALKATGKEIIICSPGDELDRLQPIIWDSLYFDKLKNKTNLKNIYLLLHHLPGMYEKPTLDYFKREEKFILKKVSGIIATGTYAENWLKERLNSSNKIIKIEPGYSFSNPSILPKKKKGIRALIMANLINRKGILPLLKLLKIYESKLNDFQLTILGSDKLEPEYAQQCKDIINDFKLDKVKYLGEKTHSECINYLQEANLYISSSFMETFGMSVREALAFNAPVWGLGKGNIRFLVENYKSGVLFHSMNDLVMGLISLSNKPELLYKQIDFLESGVLLPQKTWKETADLFWQKITDHERI